MHRRRSEQVAEPGAGCVHSKANTAGMGGSEDRAAIAAGADRVVIGLESRSLPPKGSDGLDIGTDGTRGYMTNTPCSRGTPVPPTAGTHHDDQDWSF